MFNTVSCADTGQRRTARRSGGTARRIACAHNPPQCISTTEKRGGGGAAVGAFGKVKERLIVGACARAQMCCVQM